MIKWDWSGTLRPLRNAFLAVIASAAVLTVVLLLLQPSARWDSFLLSFLASLWEDIAFFVAIGLALFIVQKNERDRHRTLADRLFILCNAREKLTDNEKHSLAELVANFLSYVHFDRIEIRIEGYDRKDHTVKMRVVRDMSFSNYTNDMEASHAIRLTLIPIGPGDIQVDPVETLEIPAKTKADGVEREVIFEGVTTPERVDEQLKTNRIGPGNHRIYKIRYNSTVDLIKRRGILYDVTTRKYTQRLEVVIVNHCNADLLITHQRRNHGAHQIRLEKDGMTAPPLTFTDLRAGECCEFKIVSPSIPSPPLLSGPDAAAPPPAG